MFSKLFKSIGVGARNSMLPAPLSGRVIPLADVQDEAFACGLLGEGAAIEPDSNRVVAPSDGKIESVFPAGHALAMRTNDGLDVLIHIGTNTHDVETGSFTKHVSDGDEVSKGDVLIEFDREGMIANGHDVTALVLIRNAAEFASIKGSEGQEVSELDTFLVARAR